MVAISCTELRVVLFAICALYTRSMMMAKLWTSEQKYYYHRTAPLHSHWDWVVKLLKSALLDFFDVEVLRHFTDEFVNWIPACAYASMWSWWYSFAVNPSGRESFVMQNTDFDIFVVRPGSTHDACVAYLSPIPDIWTPVVAVKCSYYRRLCISVRQCVQWVSSFLTAHQHIKAIQGLKRFE